MEGRELILDQSGGPGSCIIFHFPGSFHAIYKIDGISKILTIYFSTWIYVPKFLRTKIMYFLIFIFHYFVISKMLCNFLEQVKDLVYSKHIYLEVFY